MQSCFFFFNDTATTEIYTYGHTLSLHDALPICLEPQPARAGLLPLALGLGAGHGIVIRVIILVVHVGDTARSEEHTSELQSLMRHSYAVFCLKKNTK